MSVRTFRGEKSCEKQKAESDPKENLHNMHNRNLGHAQSQTEHQKHQRQHWGSIKSKPRTREVKTLFSLSQFSFSNKIIIKCTEHEIKLQQAHRIQVFPNELEIPKRATKRKREKKKNGKGSPSVSVTFN
jgi:hypothetical protein